MDRKALSAAFPVTVPVLMGYLAIGIAFGLMLQEIGYNFIWAFFMSLTIYAGSGQYLGVTLLGAAAALSTVAVMTLLINFRHLVYGLSMLEKFRGMGPRKLYMIFSLTDETYALLSSARAPVGVDPRNFYFAIALLDQSYWILGSVILPVYSVVLSITAVGLTVAVSNLSAEYAARGNEGAMGAVLRRCLAAFLILFALVAGVTVLFLIVLGHFFGQDQMLLISLGVIVLCLLVLRDRLDEKEEETC